MDRLVTSMTSSLPPCDGIEQMNPPTKTRVFHRPSRIPPPTLAGFPGKTVAVLTYSVYCRPNLLCDQGTSDPPERTPGSKAESTLSPTTQRINHQRPHQQTHHLTQQPPLQASSHRTSPPITCPAAIPIPSHLQSHHRPPSPAQTTPLPEPQI